MTADRARAMRMASLLLRPGTGDQPAGMADEADMAGVAGVVSWFGAMQAQDLNSALWSLGVRLPGSTEADVRAALERREALRTWPMRGTVHLVPARDARWMVEVLGKRALAGTTARWVALGLDRTVADQAVDVLGKALSGGGRLTRAQCLQAINQAGIDTGGQRGYHLLWYASQRGVTCIAPSIGSEQTFVLLDEWVPDPHRPDRDEALGIITRRYFRSHGPAARDDLARWTGMTVTDAKRGIAVAGDALERVTVDGREMLVAAGSQVPPGRYDDVVALPGFDEYLLGFQDRSLFLADEHRQAIVPGGNGVFQPTVVRAGRVVATWRRAPGRNRAAVQVKPLTTITAAGQRKIGRALEPYARFVGGPLVVSFG
ncbi:MAG TPA: winged helix DNA-binding domain-containing protein [Micromonosporaceae bacterium]|nr:winged helix DNA-binding domain-containing protein [Micromonosporaceae bacterium]